MKLARAVLFLSGLPFLGIGAAFLVRPEAMTALVDVALAGPLGDNDVRAVYGGLQLGCGAFLVWCSLREDRTRPGLVALLCCYGGLAAARVASLIAVGSPGPLGWWLHGGELLGLAAGAVAWSALRRTPRAQ